MEIGRKFLVTNLPDLNNYAHKDIVQGYISFSPEIRIRKANDKYYLTTKSEGTIKREEHESEIELTTYLTLLKIAKGRIIQKTRYFIPLPNSLTAELDIYYEDLNGLFTVEVEFPTLQDAQNFSIPNWFSKEITEDKRYKNKNLAANDNISSLLNQENCLKKKLKK